MSEFRFLCPECGQKILGDTDYTGTQIACPTCQKTITIPAAAAPAPAPAPGSASPAAPAGASPPQSPPRPAPTPPSAPAGQAPGPFSRLAMASLICSVFVPFGWIPGIICGHRAKAGMRRNIFLEGEKMANAGLLISYCVLIATLGLLAVFAVEHRLHGPVMVMGDSPGAIAALQSRVVDEVTIGKNENDHEVGGVMLVRKSTLGQEYRSAIRGGFFSYMMNVLPNQPMTLNCRYWGSEPNGHVFDIAVGDQIVATQNLTDMAPGHFFDMEYKIPPSLTRGKTEVQVEFLAHPGKTAGGLYGCQMLKP